MRSHSRWFTPLWLVLAFALPSVAEEGDSAPAVPEDEDRIGWVVVEASAWLSRAAGAGFDAVQVISETDPYGTRLMTLEPDSHESGRYRAGYSLSRNLGDILVTWWTHETTQERSEASPGSFVFGETFTHPLLAGMFDDGMADGYDAWSAVTIRDLRIDYSRVAFESPRATLRWSVGYRNVTHRQEMEAAYYSIVPVYDGTPVVFPIPPLPALVPLPDLARGASQFSGHGPEVGVRVDFPLHRRFRIETGFAAAILDGKTDVSYASLTSTYSVLASDGSGTIAYYPTPPFPEFETSPLLLRQLVLPIGLNASEKTSVQVLEAQVALRWKAWRELEAFFGLQVTRYGGAATEIRPKGVTLNPSGMYNFQDVSRIDKSTTYEGMLGGLSYRF